MQPAAVSDFVTYAALGTLIGGRLGYCIFYAPDLFLRFKAQAPFWGVLAVNEGGMASHGGIIGIVVGCILFAQKFRINRLYVLDIAAVAGPVGVFFGRIANFINGELVGRPCEPSFPLAVKFPQDIYQWPSQDFSKLRELSVVVEKIGITTSQWLEWLGKYPTEGSAREQVHNALLKIVESIQTGNEAAREAIAPLLLPRHPSQLYASFGEGLFLFIILFIIWYKPRKPGVIASCFVVFYAIVRIIDEMFRMPDAHIGFQWLGLTRGQWLSTAMLIVGLLMVLFWSRRPTLKVAGWGLGQNLRVSRR
jgi:phosphatidylglycerol:prolipoprotein diacylglycerol transferase